VFTPGAKPDNQTFEVMIQRGRRKRDVVRMFMAAIVRRVTGARILQKGVSWHQARMVRLKSANGRPVPVQVDGDPGGHLPGDFEVVPGGIRVLTPR
jgi:diacylglycerol kinase family enzyme